MDKTLEFYDKAAQEYIETTIAADVTELNQMFLEYLAANSSILDLGCGSGRDSKIFINNGFFVTALDGSKEFCRLASSYLKQDVLNMRFDEISFNNEFDGVWACASLLHVPSRELPEIFRKIVRAMKVGGYFFVCFKHGDFEGERNGRYFTDLTESKFRDLIREIRELEVIETSITEDVRSGRSNEYWLNVILRKVKDIVL